MSYSQFWEAKLRPRSPTDLFFSDGDIVCHSSKNKFTCVYSEDGDSDEDFLADRNVNKKSIECKEASCQKVFNSLFVYELHYDTMHRNVCCHCSVRLPTSHLLDIHIQELHATSYDRALLISHDDSRGGGGGVQDHHHQNQRHYLPYSCLLQDCCGEFSTAALRKEHMIDAHRYPPNFRYFQYLGRDDEKKRRKGDGGSRDAKNNGEGHLKAASQLRKNNNCNIIEHQKHEDENVNDINPSNSNINRININNNTNNNDDDDDDDDGRMDTTEDGGGVSTASADVGSMSDNLNNDASHYNERNNRRNNNTKRVPRNICFGSCSQRTFRR